MAHIILPPDWRIPERHITPESWYWQSVSRRTCLKLMGLGTLALTGWLPGCSGPVNEQEFARNPQHYEWTDLDRTIYPAPRNPTFTLDRPMTPEHIAAQYNNFYEFSQAKDDVWKRVTAFEPRPWDIRIHGLVHKPRTVSIDDLLRTMPIEERTYRLRCVEAWAMAVPWSGFPFKALIDWVQPLSTARFVRLTAFYNPSVAMGQRGYGPWPYTEGLTMAEAANELTLLATGIYGHPLPKQHGAPLRLVTPWKYGYKSIKSVVDIEFVREQPATFWNTLVPWEYDFQANVNPAVPHPRWLQETERMIGTNERRPTLYLNGYEPWVGTLYT
ncbi:MAG: protein-methionine-sulfoxide reductase catalytic subunit MsrP [Nitrospirae bacterium]|nr:MAG: protein-methionine-sulfoxide reductase catalytic subunit MsrP [Nitrospirota bacterium]